VSRGLALASGTAAAAALVGLGALLSGGAKSAPAHDVPTALARVVRTDVVERQQVAGTLTYDGSFAVANGSGAGVVTWLPAAGAVVRRGEPLYELDGRPVALFYGGRPAVRAFELGMSAGPDIRALQRNLLALGFDAGGALAPDGRFDVATLAAVERWQSALGLPPSGTIPAGGVVFLPRAVRVTSTTATAGAAVAAGAPILTATSTEPAVHVDLDPGAVAQVRVGDRVLVTMPDSSVVAGRTADIGRVATTSSADSQGGGPAMPTIPVTIRLLRPRADAALDQAPVQVAITSAEDRGVLAVPVAALLARPGGGYSVQVLGRRRTRTVTVTTGLFDDVAGRVEVRGPGLAAGMRVEVPVR
jgi:peptidoglycan hydrolase-like protein with peptidoglycan-binding domain